MRGLIKGAPPANVSTPTQEPASLAEWDADCQAGMAAIADSKAQVKYARTRFDSLHKRVMRDFLFVEQRNLCVYCERAIEEVQPPLPIDHWNPLSLFLQQVFNWENLHVSCLSIDTCDDRKKNVDLRLPWPVSFHYEEVFGFTSGGFMYVRNDVDIAPDLREALERALADLPGPPAARSTLNLNHPALRAARAAAIEVEEDMAPPTPAKRQQRIATMLAQPRREAFISARLFALNGQFGLGR